jgi:dihydroflavonol-4-reductase
VAGINAFCVPDPAELFRVNVLGSVNVVSAAARAGVRRIVYTSSAATLGEAKGTTGSETSQHRGFFLSNYERSKFEAEKAVLERAGELGIDVVCVNPSSVQGPGRAGGTGKILILYLEGRLKYFVPTRISLVDTDDCTEGHLLAEQKGVPGERYVLNAGTATIEEALAMVARITGLGSKPRILPGFVASGAVGAVEAAARVRRRRPAVCREMVRTLLHGHAYDGTRATRELGLNYRPLEETLRRSIEWLRAEGLIAGQGGSSDP